MRKNGRFLMNSDERWSTSLYSFTSSYYSRSSSIGRSASDSPLFQELSALLNAIDTKVHFLYMLNGLQCDQ